MATTAPVRFIFVALIASGLATPAVADDYIILNGKPCGTFCRKWMGVGRPPPKEDSTRAEESSASGDLKPERRPRATASPEMRRAAHPTSNWSAELAHLNAAQIARVRTLIASLPTTTLLVPTPGGQQLGKTPSPTPSHLDATTSTSPEPKPAPQSAPDGQTGPEPGSPEKSAGTTSPDTTPTEPAIAARPAGEPVPEPSKTESSDASTAAVKPEDHPPTQSEVAALPKQENAPAAVPNSPAPSSTDTATPSASTTSPNSSSDTPEVSIAPTAPLPSPSPPVLQSDLGAPPPKSEGSGTYVAPSVLMILARPKVAGVSELNNKPVVIAGLSSISEADVNSAFAAAGAGAVQLKEGSWNDIDQLIGGQVSAAIVGFVTPEKAAQFVEIPGFTLLRLNVTRPSGG